MLAWDRSNRAKQSPSETSALPVSAMITSASLRSNQDEWGRPGALIQAALEYGTAVRPKKRKHGPNHPRVLNLGREIRRRTHPPRIF